MVKRTTSSFGLVGTDWQERINWSNVRKYRLNRAREAMKENNLGAMLVMYDENVRYITSTRGVGHSGLALGAGAGNWPGARSMKSAWSSALAKCQPRRQL